MKITEMISAYSGMIFGKTDYWHPEMKASQNINEESISDYYVDTRTKYSYPAKIDDKGIPILEVNGEECYYPVTVAQYALGNFDMYYDTKEENYLDVVKQCADWFVSEIKEVEPGLWGYINDPISTEYPLEGEWFSCLSQGQAMSVLARYYSVCKDEKYVEVAKRLLKSFEVLSENKGVLAYLNGDFFYEEYPSNPPSYVLNGVIFAIWGVLDLYIVTKNKKAKELYDKGVICLKNNISTYDIKGLGWSRYDLFDFKIKNITSIFYHKLHIEQLKAMYTLTSEDIFKSYATRWEKRRRNVFIYCIATIYKIMHKITVKKNSVYVKSIK